MGALLLPTAGLGTLTPMPTGTGTTSTLTRTGTIRRATGTDLTRLRCLGSTGTSVGSPWSIFYLVIFGAGTIAGMMFITVAMALPFAFSSGNTGWFAGRLRLASGLISVGFGCLLVYQIVVVHGLFTGDPQWTPR